MSNESLTCSNSGFAVDLPVITPDSNTFLVAESKTNNITTLGLVSLPQILSNATNTSVDSWVISNSCNVGAATSWFLANNVKISRYNSWLLSNSANILQTTSWITSNSARLSGAQTIYYTGSTDSAAFQIYASWVSAHSAAFDSVVATVTSLTFDESREDVYLNWVAENSAVLQTAVTVLQELTSTEPFLQHAATWTTNNSANIEQTVAWLRLMSSVRETHSQLEQSIFTWVSNNSSDITDILEKNSEGFVNWVSANSADHAIIYDWVIQNAATTEDVIAWVQGVSSDLPIIRSSINLALNKADDAFTWIENNSSTFATDTNIVQTVAWVADNSGAIDDIGIWHSELSANNAELLDAISWISGNSARAIQAATWVEIISNVQELHSQREDRIFSWVEENSTLDGFINLDIEDTNATIAWVSQNSAKTVKVVEWLEMLSSTQELHDERETQIFSWVEDSISAIEWITLNTETIEVIKEWYSLSSVEINNSTEWLLSNHSQLVQVFDWVQENRDTFALVLTSLNITTTKALCAFAWITNNQQTVATVNAWVAANSSYVVHDINADAWVESNSSLLENIEAWYHVHAVNVVNWVEILTSTQELYNDQINQLFSWVEGNSANVETLGSLSSTAAWVLSNSSALTDIEEWYSTSPVDGGSINEAVSWVQEYSAGASAAADWFNVLSSAQVQHDESEEQALSWVTSNSSTLTDIEEWYDTRTFDEQTATEAVSWVQEYSAGASAAADWLDVLSSTQATHDERESQIFSWVEDNSASLSIPVDNEITTVWVSSNSAFISDIEEWYSTNPVDGGSINEAVSWVQEYSAIAETATAWLDILSSAQSQHNEEESQAFSWVENNSATLSEIEEWYDTAASTADTNTWVQEHSAQTEEVANWVSLLTSVQAQHDTRENQIFSWVEENSANTNTVIENSTTTAWVTSNSSLISDIEEWYSTKTLDEAAAIEAVSWVQEYSAGATAAADWFDVLSGIQSQHDEKEEQIFSWVASNSSTLTDIEEWYNNSTLNEAVVTDAAMWVQEYSAGATAAADWLDVLSSAQASHDILEDQVFSWVEENSAVTNATNTYVTNNSTSLTNVITSLDTITSLTETFEAQTEWWTNNNQLVDAVTSWVSSTTSTWVGQIQLEAVISLFASVDTWVRGNSSNTTNAVNFIASNSSSYTDSSTWVASNSTLIDQVLTVVASTSSLLADIEDITNWSYNISSVVPNLVEIALWVQANSSTNATNLQQWVENVSSDIDQVNTWVANNSADLTTSSEWVLDNKQIILDTEDYVYGDLTTSAISAFQWVSDNKQLIYNTQDTVTSLDQTVQDMYPITTWLQENSATINSVTTWVENNSATVVACYTGTFSVSDQVEGHIVVTHGLTTESVLVQLYDEDFNSVIGDIQVLDDNSISLTFDNTVTGNFKVVVFGNTDIHEQNQLQTNVTAWYVSNSADIRNTITWVKMLTSSTSTRDARTNAVVALVESVSGTWSTLNSSQSTINWVDANRQDILTTNAWTVSNSAKVTESYLLSRQTAPLATKASTWVDQNSAALISLSVWASSTSGTIENATLQSVVDWYNTDKNTLTSTVEWLSSNVDVLPVVVQWINSHGYDVTVSDGWVRSNSSNLIESLVTVDTLSSTVAYISDWIAASDETLTEITTWVTENSARSNEAANWIEMLSSAQALHDAHEDQIFNWVRNSSAVVDAITDTTAVVSWVESNSSTFNSIEEWYSDSVSKDGIRSNVTAWVQEYSAGATAAAEWFDMLSSAQTQHEDRENQVFGWVESNSAFVESVVDSRETISWVASNSSLISDIEEWYDISTSVDAVRGSATAWVQEYSAGAAAAAEWFDVLSSTQASHDQRESEVLSWVEGHSAFVDNVVDSSATVNWVATNSSVLEEVGTWYTTNTFDETAATEAVSWVREYSAGATQAAEWLDLLTNSQATHDAREEEIFSWVEQNSAAQNIDDDNTDITAWVEDNSAFVSTIETWYNLSAVDVNTATEWLLSNHSQLIESFDWIQENRTTFTAVITTLTGTTTKALCAFAWVTGNQQNVNTLNTWVSSNSSTLVEIEEWYRAVAADAVGWLGMLSSAQALHDLRENQIFSWIENNSANVREPEDNSSITAWVTSNSTTIANIEEWYNNSTLDEAAVTDATSWVQEYSAGAVAAVEWIDLLTNTQSTHNTREEQIFSWIEDNSAGLTVPSDSSSVIAWVESNSSLITDIEEWYTNSTLNEAVVSDAATWVQNYSAGATQAAEWLDLLTNSQATHDAREEEIFSWVENNSSNVLTTNDSNSTATAWVTSNSSILTDIEEWYSAGAHEEATTLDAVTWVQEYSAGATQAVEWIELLSSAQAAHDEKEEQIFSWVTSNSSTLTDIEDWYNRNSTLNEAVVTDAAMWVQEYSAGATAAAEWLDVLSSTQASHDAREEEIFSWVESNSSNILTTPDSNSSVTAWVTSNSTILTDIEEWYNNSTLNETAVTDAASWVQEYSAGATAAAEWIDILTSTQTTHDEREEQIFSWIEENSSNVGIVVDTEATVAWVSANSSTLTDIEDWYNTSTQNEDVVAEAVTWVQVYSAGAAGAAEWFEMLSSAQTQHEDRENQVFSWVEQNSANVSLSTVDGSKYFAWVTANSSTLGGLEEWYNTKAADAVNWIELLSSAQSRHELREDQIFTWVENNSANIDNTRDTSSVVTWVSANSTIISNLEEWYNTSILDEAAVVNATSWVQEYSAGATAAAEWFDVLSSAQAQHDEIEDKVFSWVAGSSASVKSIIDSGVVGWLTRNSSAIEIIKNWYDLSSVDINTSTDWLMNNHSQLVYSFDWVQENRDTFALVLTALNNTTTKALCAFAWVSNNQRNISTINAWVTANSANVRDNTETDATIHWVATHSPIIEKIEDWYKNDTRNSEAVSSTVAWVQEYSAGATQAAEWIRLLSGLDEGHEEFETAVLSWVSANSTITGKVSAINTWITGTSSFTTQTSNWVSANSADLTTFATWWRYLSGLEEGHADLEKQVMAWVVAHSGDGIDVDAWVRDHSAQIMRDVAWVEDSSAYFIQLTNWAISSSAHYDTSYSWVTSTSSRILSAVEWVEMYDTPLIELNTLYTSISDDVENAIHWVTQWGSLAEYTIQWYTGSSDFIDQNIDWLAPRRDGIQATVTWASAASAHYEQAYTWVVNISDQIRNDHTELGRVAVEVALDTAWINTHGPAILDCVATVIANSGNDGAPTWSTDTNSGGGGAIDPCGCEWTKTEPITNPLGLLTYGQNLSGWTLKEILEKILYINIFRITLQPVSHITNPGNTESFTVSAIGTSLNYQWYKDSVLLTDKTSRLLTLQSITSSDEGVYRAVVTDVVDTVSSTLSSDPATLTVNRPPTVTVVPSTSTIIAPAGITFTAANITGSTPITYQWYKNRSLLSGKTSTVLTYSSTTTADAAVYMLCATNMVASVTAEGVLTVNVIGIRTNPIGITLNPGQTTTLTVEATGTQPIVYQWKKNSVTLDGATLSSLLVTEAGTYMAVASNAAGTANSTNAVVNFTIPPTITVTPSTLTVIAPATITFNTTHAGTTPITYQWYKDGVSIVGKTDDYITITNTTTANAGVYTVSATNVAGVASDFGTAIVNAIGIITNPTGITLNPSETTTLTVEATGTQPIVYQWKKNSVTLDGATLSSLLVTEAGTYMAVASNAAGTVNSTNAVVIFNGPPTVTVTPATLTIVTPATLTFNTTNITGTAPITYQWYKNSTLITGATGTSLTITPTTTADTGTYMISAHNVAGNATSTGTAVVNQGLTITTQPVGSAINPGATYQMHVSATGTTPITYQWKLNNVVIPGATSTDFSTTSAGTYMILVSNVVGTLNSINATVTLNSLGFSIHPGSSAVAVGDAVTFVSLATGTPTITYQWYKDSVILSGKTTANLTIASAQLSDIGSYRNVATNTVGSVSSNIATLGVTAPVGYTAYWGKFLNSTQSSTLTPRLLSSDSGIKTINDWYVANKSDSRFPLGKHTSGVIGTKTYLGFRGISAETFTQVFSGGSTSITGFTDPLEVTYPLVPSTIDFTEYEKPIIDGGTGLTVASKYKTGLANQYLWLFVPCNMPGTPWNVIKDINDMTVNPDATIPTLTAPMSTAMFVGGVSAAYYSYQIFAQTAETYLKFTH